MPAPVRNKKLLRRVANVITKHPEQYDQSMFVYVETWAGDPVADCGTAACIAGWAVTLQDGRPLLKIWEWYHRYGPDMEERGRKALGLTRVEANRLFGPHWKPADPLTVPEALRAIANGASVESVSA